MNSKNFCRLNQLVKKTQIEKLSTNILGTQKNNFNHLCKNWQAPHNYQIFQSQGFNIKKNLIHYKDVQ